MGIKLTKREMVFLSLPFSKRLSGRLCFPLGGAEDQDASEEAGGYDESTNQRPENL